MTRSHPGVYFPPPLVFLLPFFASFLLDQRLPFLIFGDDEPIALSIAGTALLAAGFALMFWARAIFWTSKTTVLPFKPASALVIVPPFTFSRNPMYLGLAIAYVGGALATNWAWPFVFLPIVLAVTRWHIIAREERYLTERFGAQYVEYCARVRRWF